MLHSNYQCKEGVVSRRARKRKRRCRRIQGASQGAQQPDHRETSGGSRWGEAAMATGARVAAAIACAKRSMGRRSEGVVVEKTSGAGGSEVCRRLARPRDTNWGQRKLPCLPEYRNNGLRGNNAGLTVLCVIAVCVQYTLFAIIESKISSAVLLTRSVLLALHSRLDEEGARNLLQRTSSFWQFCP